MVCFSLVNHVFYCTRQAQQYVDVNPAMLRMHQLHAGRGFGANSSLYTSQRSSVQTVGFMHDHQVGGGQLVFKQLMQRRIMVEVVVCTALGIHRHRVVGEVTRSHSGCIHHSHNCVHSKRRA